MEPCAASSAAQLRTFGRAEIGSDFGMSLECVSRALSRVAREQLIRFAEARRRHVQIPDLGALLESVQDSMTRASACMLRS
jgi:CRP/FNR family transcriptional regulator